MYLQNHQGWSSEIRLNGEGFPDTDLGEFGRHGFHGSYEIDLEGSRTGKSIRLFFLFDEVDPIRGIAGFFVQTAAKAGQENDPFMGQGCVLKVQRISMHVR